MRPKGALKLSDNMQGGGKPPHFKARALPVASHNLSFAGRPTKSNAGAPEKKSENLELI